MNDPERDAGYVPNDAYSRADWDAVSDNAELTDAEVTELRPAHDVLPAALLTGLRAKRGRGPQKAPTKRKISLRLDQAVVDHFRATGTGWQARMGELLKKAAGL